MVDVNRIALYLAGNFPPYYKPFEKGYFIELLILNSGGTLDDVKVATLNQQSSNDQQFFSMCLSRLERHSPALVATLIEELAVPEDVVGVPITGVTTIQTLETKIEELTKTVNEVTKPLLITEGVTDRDIITTARKKLHDEEMPFEVISAGLPGNVVGGADTLMRQLECANVFSIHRKVIGLFDNDGTGNAKFKGLKKELFGKYEIHMTTRKCLTSDVFAVLLPPPEFRKEYVGTSISKRYLEIEHYFEDSVLQTHEMIKGPIATGSTLSEIGNNKTTFASIVENLPPTDFVNFEVLFKVILSLI